MVQFLATYGLAMNHRLLYKAFPAMALFPIPHLYRNHLQYTVIQLLLHLHLHPRLRHIHNAGHSNIPSR